ncbi:2-amino-4-hydroxy-6-hydroxymethyldihydropteridine diphosphokinase, partial [Peribacillus sp. NPDC056705]|uniref:2-amino-4-hydroxy-6- hydroxymethyldihydropteridine diphosphokinase n=1 Tax=Peribacillus sp. NPDC056705 TaxID=3345918 RepID=UPI00374A975E
MNSHATSEYSEAYIALGANLGDREGNLMEALERLDEVPGVTVTRVSHLYETEPVGYVDQPMFINLAAVVSTSLSPHGLLAQMQQIEKQLGRVRHIHWGPRTVDLDLLWMEGWRLDTPELILPHPRMFERAFVLRPLADIVSEFEPSGLYPSVKTALAHLEGKKG